MFVDRRVFKIKAGRMQEMIELAETQRAPFLQLRGGAGALRYLANKVVHRPV
jgi:hypothetical protein